MGRIKDSYRRYKRWTHTKSWGLRIRNKLHEINNLISPYVKILIPNFRVAHYFYIVTWVILGSILMYPVKNLPYTDILFMAAGASTQAGLNTIDLNTIGLYQQIIIYIITTFTTPIFIHGAILVFRLYSFERHFDNIKESSKLNFKMRRSATLAGAKSQSSDPTQINTRANQGLGFGMRKNSTTNTNQGTFYTSGGNTKTAHSSYSQNFEMQKSPQNTNSSLMRSQSPFGNGDTLDGKLRSSPSINSKESKSNLTETNNDRDIRFGNLPLPKRKEINPQDMLRSIAMNRERNGGNPGTSNTHNYEDGPVLVIKSPKEIENEKNQSSIHFNITKPKRIKKKRRWSSKNIRKPFRRKSSTTIDPDLTITDIDSIDSECQSDDDNEDGDDEREDEEGDEEEDDDIFTPKNRINDSEEVESSGDELTRAQSNLVLPSKDETGGKKFNKRSNTLEVTPGRNGSFIKSPTFEKMLRKKKSRMITGIKRVRSGMRRVPSNALTTDDEYDSNASFDSEASNDEEDNTKLTKTMSGKYLSWVPTVGRNSTFVHLTEDQKEELGGVEYRAVKLLVKIILFYYIGFHLIAFALLLPWTLRMKTYNTLIKEQGVAPSWWAIFQASSSFNDLGFTLTPNSLMSFNKSIYVMVVVAFFVVIGNTGFPIFLRFIIWILFKCSKQYSLFKESLGFLLDHPRRCFTLLFPSIPTWWLFFILVVLNAVDLVLFIILDLNNSYLKEIPIGYRIMDGLFQAFSTRTAGFSVVDLSQLHPAVQVSYMLMMYISVLPLAISIRRTNVYEEQSLGVYLRDRSEEEEEGEDTEKTPRSFIGAHLRNQLSFDLWFIFLGLFIICIAEGGKLNKNENPFSVFKILFEIISAYGTVGLSLGYPGINASFSAEFSVLSKLVIIAMMIRGRHRGLPYSLDRAIMLPDDQMQRRDQMQEHHAVRRHSEDNISFVGRVLSRRPSNFGTTGRRRSWRSLARNQTISSAPYIARRDSQELVNLNPTTTYA